MENLSFWVRFFRENLSWYVTRKYSAFPYKLNRVVIPCTTGKERMEHPTILHDLRCLRDAITLQKLIKQEQDDSPDEYELGLMDILAGYIQDLRYRLGFAEPYRDSIHRLSTLKDILRQMNPIFDKMTELANGQPLQGEAFGLNKFLWQIALDFSRVIRAIEEQHPEMKWFFDADRAYYAKSLEGEEALKAWVNA